MQPNHAVGCRGGAAGGSDWPPSIVKAHAQTCALLNPCSLPPAHCAASVISQVRSSRSSLSADLRLWEVDYGSLELMRQIGEGSFGRVYLAK